MSSTLTTSVELPTPAGTFEPYILGEPGAYPRPEGPLRSRRFLAAAHVVCDPLAEPDGTGRARLDWDATMAYRHHLWSYGLGVADAMDTAQRGMGLDWETTVELIERSGAEAAACGGALVCGAGTDQLPAGPATLEAIEEAYLSQCAVVQDAGAQVVLLASRALCATERAGDDFHRVYGAILRQVSEPVVLHWLGEAFDPQLAGYWGSRQVDEAMDVVVDLICDNVDRIDGIKISLLDASLEVELRRRLPEGVRLYTGDDFNYPELIRGDGNRASDALLGIFDAIAPAASAALRTLDDGDVPAFEAILAPTVPLARHLFSAPTYHYKTGIVLLAYLNGHQSHFRMVGGLESARSVAHLAEIVRLADRAGLLVDPELAAARVRRVLAVAGIGT